MPLDPGTTATCSPFFPGSTTGSPCSTRGCSRSGRPRWCKGGNTTAYPVQLQVTASHGLPAVAPTSRRGTPLPSLTLGSRSADGAGDLRPGRRRTFPRRGRCRLPRSGQSNPCSRMLPARTRSRPARRCSPRMPRPTPGGEIARLQEIVQGPFLGGDMEPARQKLMDFLSLPRKPDLAARARFYLGQVYYFQGKPRDALMEFLSARGLLLPAGRAVDRRLLRAARRRRTSASR